MAAVFASPTFSNEDYRKYRPTYPRILLDEVLSKVTTPTKTLAIDVGCGPGTFTHDLAPHFARVVGIDPSEGMIAAASEKDNVEFRVGSAIEMTGVEDGSVDLITSATAAHWFPESWWGEAVRVLKPGGAVALFTYGYPLPSPSAPHRAIVIEEMLKYRAALAPHSAGGNGVAQSLYDLLPVPGTHDIPSEGWTEVTRKKWMAQVKPTDPPSALAWELTLEAIRLIYAYSSGSPYHKWLEANPGKPDLIDETMNRIKERSGLTDEALIPCGLNLGVVFVQKKE
ncbi:S-adenosyl-L-methionine-dependent methyltransferase [Pseudohyphozyma bogoriensis]|nr:S-adenosyl-L-methionine-dependent methyltransferase [Pseudohyphozyma bogoriensis]